MPDLESAVVAVITTVVIVPLLLWARKRATVTRDEVGELHKDLDDAERRADSVLDVVTDAERRLREARREAEELSGEFGLERAEGDTDRAPVTEWEDEHGP